MATLLRATATKDQPQLLANHVGLSAVEFLSTGDYYDFPIQSILQLDDGDDVLESMLIARSEGDVTLSVDGGATITAGDVADADFKEYIRASQRVSLVPPEWTDLRIVPGAFTFSGSSDPVLTDWQPGGSGATFKVWEFDNDEQAFFTAQMPHNYKEGTDLRPHIHWTPRDRGVAEDGKTVAWKLDLTIANVDGVFLSSTTYDLTATCDGVDEKGQVVGGVTLDGSLLTVSHIIVGRIYRGPTDSWVLNTNGNKPVLLEVDFHYQLDTLGSRQEYIK